MTLKEIKIKILKMDKSYVWLAQQLGYSTKYMYDCIKKQNTKEIERIKKILENN